MHVDYRDLAQASSYLVEEYIDCYEDNHEELEGIFVPQAILCDEDRSRLFYSHILVHYVHWLGFIATSYRHQTKQTDFISPKDLTDYWEMSGIEQSTAVTKEQQQAVKKWVTYFNASYYLHNDVDFLPLAELKESLLCIVSFSNAVIKTTSLAGDKWGESDD